MKYRYYILIFSCVIVLASSRKAKDLPDVTCRDENNNPVDWFYLYKLPKNKFTTNPLIQKGVAYMFITPNTVKKGWTLSEKSINDVTSIPGLTLSPLYKSTNQFLSVIYNDQPPSVKNETNSNTSIFGWLKSTIFGSETKPKKRRQRKNSKTAGGGHTKGVVITNHENGIWLVHSVPKYPPLPENSKNIEYSYPATGERYGQSFLCMSLPSVVIDLVGVQLSYNEPKIIFSHVPGELSDLFSSIVNVINDETVTNSPWSRVARLTTNNGAVFKSFAKSANFKDDIYDGLIAQYLKSDFLVESWINGPGVLQSNCSFKYKVNNIEKIAFANKNIAFSSHSDHSKWAVSVPQEFSRIKFYDESNQWVCVGDINRAESQESRGGGSVCMSNSDLWKIYSDSVNSIEPCDRPKKT